MPAFSLVAKDVQIAVLGLSLMDCPATILRALLGQSGAVDVVGSPPASSVDVVMLYSGGSGVDRVRGLIDGSDVADIRGGVSQDAPDRWVVPFDLLVIRR